MDKENARNTVIFVVAVLALTMAYQFFVVSPAQKRAQLAAQQKAAAEQTLKAPGATAQPGAFVPVEEALARSQRVRIDTPDITGSISLTGARFDDLELKTYHQTIDPTSPPVEILSPEGAQYAYFVHSGWTGQNLAGLPDRNTDWQLTKGDVLTPSSPITLSYQAENGLIFTRQISVDDQFMFTITDTVANNGTAPATVGALRISSAYGRSAPAAAHASVRRGRDRRAGRG